MAEAFDPARTAILAMDCQAGLVAVYTGTEADAFTQRAAAVLRAGRAAGMTVIHVRIGFRKGLPEASNRNRLLAAIKASPQHQKLFEGELGAIHPGLGPEPGDIVVVKHRISAFTGTDLPIILRAQEIDTLILFGIATSGAVLSTLTDASDADFRLVVVSDCCADTDADLHRTLLHSLFPQRASVMTSTAFIAITG
jgi:nicotinamidase-related amidase